MKIVLLGTGGPRPDVRRHGPALVVRLGDENLLFDTGRGVVLQLVRAGVPLDAVNPVFLTHHHYDHIGDLGDVILSTWLQGRQGPLRIFGPEGLEAIVAALIDRVYAKDIEFRAKGEPAVGGWKPVTARDVGAGRVCEGAGWTVAAEHVVHGHGLGVPNFRWVCLGYRLEAEGKVVAISGDTIECEGLDRLARGADVLVQCCYLADAEITTPHAERLARYVHTSSSRVGKIAARAGVKRLVLTHFREKPDALLREIERDVRRDYDGPLVLGEDLVEIEV
jgi:ribonuclease Z